MPPKHKNSVPIIMVLGGMLWGQFFEDILGVLVTVTSQCYMNMLHTYQEM